MKRTKRRDTTPEPPAPVATGMLHTAADRVGPLAQAAADRVGPLAEAAADRIEAVADRVGPLAHSAAERVGPLAQTAAGRVGPLAHSAADRVGPLAHAAAGRVTPLAGQAAERVTPYAQLAAGYVAPYAAQVKGAVSPYATSAAERIAPLAGAAKERGTQVATVATERVAPAFGAAVGTVAPTVVAARSKVTDTLVPRLTEVWGTAAATPLVLEAAKRGRATWAAARGELTFPEAGPERGRSKWPRRLLVVAGVGGASFVVVRRLLSRDDADWQAARPTTPYAPPEAAADTTSTDSWSAATDATASDLPVPEAATAASLGLVEDELVEDDLAEAYPIAPEPGGADVTDADLLDGDGTVTADEDAFGELADSGTGITEADSDALVLDDDADAEATGADATADLLATGSGFGEGAPPVGETDALDSDPADVGAPLPDAEYVEITVPTTGPADLSADTVLTESGAGEAAGADYGTTEVLGGDDSAGAVAAASPYGLGSYLGDQPPTEFYIKGNQRSMKYHLPESPGYASTSAEVWFASEEAAEQAGFTRARH